MKPKKEKKVAQSQSKFQKAKLAALGAAKKEVLGKHQDEIDEIVAEIMKAGGWVPKTVTKVVWVNAADEAVDEAAEEKFE
jgi:hypothetical protein